MAKFSVCRIYKVTLWLNFSLNYRVGRMEKPESGIRNRSRKRNRNQNRNPNLRNKTWRRFCLKSVTNHYCSIKTFHPHITFIYCYYIFYCRIFGVRRKIFLREFHISHEDAGIFLGIVFFISSNQK